MSRDTAPYGDAFEPGNEPSFEWVEGYRAGRERAGSLDAQLEEIRYRHANIEGSDGAFPERLIRKCASDGEAWPCQTVQVIDLVLAWFAGGDE